MKPALAVISRRKGTFWLVWFMTLSFFLWVNKLNLLAYILGQSDLTIAGIFGFILGVYVNFFTYIVSPVALTTLVFSILAAANITLLIHFARSAQKSGKASNAGAMVAVIGSHCLSCGGSLAAPIITALAGTGTYFSAQRFATGQLLATGANLLGIMLMLWSINRVTSMQMWRNSWEH